MTATIGKTKSLRPGCSSHARPSTPVGRDISEQGSIVSSIQTNNMGAYGGLVYFALCSGVRAGRK